MSCHRWQELLSVESVDEMDGARKRDFLAHLQVCPSCRQMAAESDPTLVFSLLPAERVEEREVEEIRRSVQTLRRVRALEASWSRRNRWSLAAVSFAALLVVAVLLIPQSSSGPQEVPFAGAVGVGSGLVRIPQTSVSSPVEWHVELARSPRLVELAGTSHFERIGRIRLTTQPGESAVGDLGQEYRIQLRSLGGPSISNAEGFDLRLSRTNEQGEVLLFRADLQPRPNVPLLLGVPASGRSAEQLWLRVTWTTDRDRNH